MAAEEALRLPEVDAVFLQLLGVVGGVGGERHRVVGRESDDLVLAVLRAGLRGGGVVVGEEHVRFLEADQPDEHRRDAVAPKRRQSGIGDLARRRVELVGALVRAPGGKRFGGVLRVAEVVEVEVDDLGAEVAGRALGLVGAERAEGFVEVGADLVLPALAAREEHRVGHGVHRAAVVGERLAVLVVRVGGEVHHDPRRGPVHAGRAAAGADAGHGLRGGAKRNGGGEQREREAREEREHPEGRAQGWGARAVVCRPTYFFSDARPMPAAPDARPENAPTLADDQREFLFELLQMPSPTGYEAPGQRVWASRVRDVADRIEADAYGNCWATVEPKKATDRTPKLLLEAHADEIGFVVKYVTKEGFLHVDRLGGSDHTIARGKRVLLLGDDGPVLGVVGNTAIHLRERGKDEKVPKLEELFVDVGAASREEVARRGLRVGHPAVYVDEADLLTETRLIGRALDNRLGGFVIAEVTRRLADEDAAVRPAWTVHAANCVQEEIGGNGAKMLAYRLQPDAAVVLDVTHATDSPGISNAKHGEVKLGLGPTVTHGTVNHPAVVQRLMDVAKAEGIPLQHESSSRFSGTDTDVIFTARSGVPAALVSIPMRYMHSTVETVDLADVLHTIDLLTAFARSLKADDVFSNSILD